MLKREVLPPRRRRPLLQVARSATLEVVCCSLLGAMAGWLIAEAQNLGDEDALAQQQAGRKLSDATPDWATRPLGISPH